MQGRQVVFKTYCYVVAGLGSYILATNIPDLSRGLSNAVFLASLVVLGELSPVPVPRGKGSVSVTAPLLFTIVVLHGPAYAAWIASIATLRKKDLLGQVPLHIVLFNRGMLVLSIQSFSFAYLGLGGRLGAFGGYRDLMALVAGAALFNLVNSIIVSIGFAFMLNTSVLSVWLQNIFPSLPSILALIPIGVLMTVVCVQGDAWYLLLFWIPLLVAKYSLEKYNDLREAYSDMAGALSNAIDVRDSYTRGHSERVAEYAAMLAKELKMTDDRIDLIKYVGLLHDVGKVGIRDAIIKKPGAFTYEEYEEMKEHAAMGADMLIGMKFLGKGQQWVRHHHERWDGKGFPDGLRGEDIPLEARMLALADSFDAMTTDRPYKNRMSFEDAKKEILRCSGTQFDPDLVPVMVKVIDNMIANRK
ncbi:MAG: HD-GYP domain-containing protein [Bacillota bacterium]